MHCDRSLRFACGEYPNLGGGDPTEGTRNAVMFAKIAGYFGLPALGKIGGAPADHAPNCAKASSNQTTVGKFADPNCEIDMLLLQVDEMIGQGKTHVDVRM